MNASIHYHSRGHDLLTLATLCNERAGRARYTFDITRPLRLVLKGEPYWYLWGTSVVGEPLHYSWLSIHDDGRRPEFQQELERCHAIRSTVHPEVALDRLIALERHRARENSP